jgi:thiol-disulfide isomerase/thioredoxin
MVMIALGALCLVNLVLTLRLVRELRMRQAIHDNLGHGARSELTIGDAAPPFQATTLSGQGVTEQRLFGRPLMLVFVSPHCGVCRSTLATLAEIGPLARRAAGVEVVVVSDTGAPKTRSWLELADHEDDVVVMQPVLAAPPSQTRMITDYDPLGLFPYFCCVDEEGRVRGRGAVRGPEWNALVSHWLSMDPAPAAAPAPSGAGGV